MRYAIKNVDTGLFVGRNGYRRNYPKMTSERHARFFRTKGHIKLHMKNYSVRDFYKNGNFVLIGYKLVPETEEPLCSDGQVGKASI